jgi:hypothetical protein
MKWQTADWFIVVIFLAVAIFLVFFAKYFVGRGRRGAHRGDGKSDGRPPRAEGDEHERQGPTLNM